MPQSGPKSGHHFTNGGSMLASAWAIVIMMTAIAGHSIVKLDIPFRVKRRVRTNYDLRQAMDVLEARLTRGE